MKDKTARTCPWEHLARGTDDITLTVHSQRITAVSLATALVRFVDYSYTERIVKTPNRRVANGNEKYEIG